MTAILREGLVEVEEWPLALPPEVAAVRCVCLVEPAPHVPAPAAIVVYGSASLALALAAWAVGRVQRIRRKVRG